MKQIPLTRGKFAKVDDADFDWLNQWKWSALCTKNKWYAVRGGTKNGTRYYLYMHRELAAIAELSDVDHWNGDGLDNQRENLRPMTHAQNIQNQSKLLGCSSQYKGVTWDLTRKKWKAQIRCDKQTKFLGRFNSEKAAAHARDKAALEKWGSVAWLNFPIKPVSAPGSEAENPLALPLQ